MNERVEWSGVEWSEWMNPSAEAVSKSEAANVGRVQGFFNAFWETFSLVFIAEWGDRQGGGRSVYAPHHIDAPRCNSWSVIIYYININPFTFDNQ